MRRGIILGAIVAALAVTALWWLFVVSPRNEEVADINAQLDAAEAREDSLRTQIRQLTSIKDQEVSYLFAIGQMETSIPENPEEAAFIDQVNFLADRTGVDLTNLTLAPPTSPIEEGASGFEIPTRIAVEGQYFEVLGFLYGLEAMERLVRVDSLNLSPQAAPTQEEETAPPDEGGDTTTTTIAPTEEPRPRPDQTLLSVDISAALFTRTQVQLDPEQVADLIGLDGTEEEGNGDGSDGTTTTTTSTTPTETTTTTSAGTDAGGDE
jgi:Tfp pilus assembly protein PilO